MARLTLALLGPLHVTLDGRPVNSLAYAKVCALLAYLAIEAQPHRREALAALLWPEQDSGAARTSLRTALASLRRAIGDQTGNSAFLLVSHDTIQLNPSADVALDVTAFAALLRASSDHKHPGEA